MAVHDTRDCGAVVGLRVAASAPPLCAWRWLGVGKLISVYVGFGLSTLITFGCKEPSAPASAQVAPAAEEPVAPVKRVSREPAAMPAVLLNEELQETPGKAMISQDLLVSGEITEANLRQLLIARHDELATRTGFKFRTGPNAMYLTAYGSLEHYHAKQGQWVAMLTQSPMDRAPEILFRMAEFEASKAPPEDKFGKTEAERMSLYRDIVWRQRWSARDAEERIPTPVPGEPGYSKAAFGRAFKAQAGLGAKLLEEYLNRLAKMNGLKRSQLDAIRVEGLEKSWPTP